MSTLSMIIYYQWRTRIVVWNVSVAVLRVSYDALQLTQLHVKLSTLTFTIMIIKTHTLTFYGFYYIFKTTILWQSFSARGVQRCDWSQLHQIYYTSQRLDYLCGFTPVTNGLACKYGIWEVIKMLISSPLML